MKLKRVLCVVMAAAMVLGLAACGSAGDGGKDSGSGDAQTNESNQGETQDPGKEEEPSGEGQVLKVAAVETAYGQDMWKEVVAAFEADHEGVTVELVIDKNLEDVITPEMKTGVYPDVIMRAVGTEQAMTETFIRDNNLVDLTDVRSMKVPGEEVTVEEKMLPGFLDNTIVNPYGDGKTYLMPMFYGPCGLFYNKGLFAEKGWEVPETWDEMWELAETAKAEGIYLFTYPTTGYFDAFFYSLLHEIMGQEMFAKALRYEEGIWDTPEAQQAFDIVEKLVSYTEPTTPANATDDTYQKNQQLVLDNKALFMPNGNWVISEMVEAPRAEGFDWGFTALPAVEEGGERASYSFFEQVWMPAGAENQELGKEFIAYLYSDKAAAIFAEKGNAVQPIKGMVEKLSGDNQTYYGIYEEGAVAVLDAFAATEPVEGITIRGTFWDPINSMVTGDKTRDDWVNQIKTDSDALRAALK